MHHHHPRHHWTLFTMTIDSSPEGQLESPPGEGDSQEDPSQEEEEGSQEEDESQDDDEDDAVRGDAIQAVPTLNSLKHLRNVGKEAVCWCLSSAKPGNGVDQIRDGTCDTYWQSDGGQPHTIRVHFSRRVAVSHIALYLDYALDESYTPKKISVKIGMTAQDLTDSCVVDLHEPQGWCLLPLRSPPEPLAESTDENEDIYKAAAPKTHLVEIAILSMHQNGRDTHVRQVQLFGPRRTQQQKQQQLLDKTIEMKDSPYQLPQFETLALSQFSTIR
jgi:anaphase-promoting complex subunit 10